MKKMISINRLAFIVGRLVFILPFIMMQLSCLQGECQDSDSSYLSLSLSATRIVTGSLVTISGMSIKFGTMKDVEMTVKGNAGTETKTIPLTDSGHFKTTWGTGIAGEYQISVRSSNRKSSKTATVKVFRLVAMDSVVQGNKDATIKAYDQLTQWLGDVKSKLGPTDAGELQKKFDQLTDKKNKVMTIFNDVANLGKSLDNLQKAQGGSGGGNTGTISPQLTSDLTKLTDDLSGQAQAMETLNTAASHKAYDNTICEYLQMVSEACAAFSTFSNFFEPTGIFKSSIVAIGRDVSIDKGVPMAVGAATSGVNGTVSDMAKEATKFATTAVTDIGSLSEAMGKAGFTGDIVTMCTSYIMSKYCGTMSGDMSQDYKCTFTNANKQVWWEYTYHNEATVKLRYLKSAATASMIKMKGNIEGNATKFTIYQKVSEMDAFKAAMKNRAQIFSICLYAPPTMPVATSQADAATGFGAVARAIVTPAYFNIPIDADYNPETGQLKMYCNEAIMDYSPSVQYVYGYLCIAAMIPLTTRVNFPINKAKLTIAKVIEKNNDFQVKAGADNKLSFTKTASWTNGSGGSIEHNIKMTMSAKSD